MPLLPFYIQQSKKLNIVIVGGGYAGIAALTTFLRYMPDANITIVDPRSQHVKITHLHETFRYPLQDFLVPFTTLEQRFGCRHVCSELIANKKNILQWQNEKFITIDSEKIEFDYLLVTTGITTQQTKLKKNVLDLNSFLTKNGPDLLNSTQIKTNQDKPYVSIVGGGATGIQFLFEIAHFFQRKKIECNLRLIHSNDRVLQQFPTGFSDYTEARMKEFDIEHYPNNYYHEQLDDSIVIEERRTGKKFYLPSEMTLLFPGNSQENRLSANTFGQILIDNKPLNNVFTAGDCSKYQSYGSNTMSAQSSVRKGKLAARNILRSSGKLKLLEPYLHHDLGYVVNLGPSDAVGWLALENNVVSGTPAMVIKEIVECQYDLLLNGIDTYLV